MSLLCTIFGHRSFNGYRYNSGADYGQVSCRGIDGIGREHMVLQVKCPRCGKDNYAGRFHKHQVNRENDMIDLIDPNQERHVFMSIAPNDTQYPYKVIGNRVNGFVAESTFKSVVHELANTKVELNRTRKELEHMSSFKLGEGESLSVREDSPREILWAEIYRLRAMVEGPEGFKTWKDAAVYERYKRVAMEKELAQVNNGPASRELWKVELEAKSLYGRWSDHKGWIPWIDFGDSVMQNKARDLARASLRVEREGYPT